MRSDVNSTGDEAPRIVNKLDKKILVLTRTFLPVEITTVKPVMILLCTGRAKVVDTDWALYTLEDWIDLKMKERGADNVISTVHISIEIPDVVQLVDMDKPPRFDVKFSFQNIKERDNLTCQYCYKGFSSKELTVDHVHPKSKGGRSTWTNCVAACYECNTQKADRDLHKTNLRLLRKPKKPAGIFRLNAKKIKNERWKQFI